uniref:Triacylglycerol lipase 2 n=1 Tax=Anthurium amnicola TaxID=1678845 RepID=A0A1D1Y6A8_9ARAE
MATCGMTGIPTFFCFFFLFYVFFLLSSLDLTDGIRNGVGDSTATDAVGVCSSLVIPTGYKCQEFTVKTQDGYILSMQRIPEGRKGSGGAAGQKRQPVLLQHGVLMDGMTWLLNSPEESLAYVLADSGFDVWISNTRGTRWSRRHATLDPSSRAFWGWSWDDLAMYDLPATFNFVYQQTGQKLNYVGHSLVARS